MKYATLGNTGLVVSRMCFGAMTFTAGSKWTPGTNTVDQELANEMVAACIENGVNFFDTANVYAAGESETLLGNALRSRRKDVVIATKCGMRTRKQITEGGLSRRNILMSVDASLERLGTDWIDVYIAHTYDKLTPLEETLRAFDDIVRAGKVRYLGFSNWPAWKVSAAMEIQKANGLAPFTHGQMYYSLLGRDVETEIVPMMRQYGLGLTAWSPLAGGMLSGKYTRDPQSKSAGRLATFDHLPIDPEYAFAVVDKVREIAGARNCSVAQISFAWLLAKQVVSSVVIGATKITQLRDNLAAADVGLTPEDIMSLDDLTNPKETYPYGLRLDMPDGIIRRAIGTDS